MVFGTGPESHQDTTHQGVLLASQVWLLQHLAYGFAPETEGAIGGRTAMRQLDLDK